MNKLNIIDIKPQYDYRELIIILIWRDISAQYKQAFFGIGWAIVRPIFSVLVYTLVFGKIANLSSSGIPYPLFTLCGVIAWSYFSISLEQSTTSLLNNSNLLTKVYFPRLILPLASMGRGTIDFIISFLLLMLLMAFYGYSLSITVIYFPIFILIGLSLTLGIGLFLSAVCAKYHDLKFAILFLLQIWFWLTPVAYGIENVPDNLATIFYLNPMTWIIQGFRWSLLGIGDFDIQFIGASLIISLVILMSGLLYFKKVEGEIADYI